MFRDGVENLQRFFYYLSSSLFCMNLCKSYTELQVNLHVFRNQTNSACGTVLSVVLVFEKLIVYALGQVLIPCLLYRRLQGSQCFPSREYVGALVGCRPKVVKTVQMLVLKKQHKIMMF